MPDQLIFAAITGLILGLEHALEPDHVVAVSVFVSEHKDPRSAARLGVSWGLGHTATLLLIGGGIMLLHINIPAWLEHTMEFVVGLLLIAIGASAIIRVLRDRRHVHEHDDDEVHQHFHSHRHSETHDHSHHPSGRAFLVGLAHGGAGSAAAVLLMLTMVDAAWKGVLLIALFGLGSIVGMLLVSLFISLATRWSVNSVRWQRAISGGAGSVSVALGLLIALQFLVQG